MALIRERWGEIWVLMRAEGRGAKNRSSSVVDLVIERGPGRTFRDQGRILKVCLV